LSLLKEGGCFQEVLKIFQHFKQKDEAITQSELGAIQAGGCGWEKLVFAGGAEELLAFYYFMK
jgi:hypothetical protein